MNDAKARHKSPLPVSGLLPWQSYFLALVLGVFAYRHAVPALVALAVLVVSDTSMRGWTRRLPVLAFIFCTVFGFGYASQRTPEPVDIPAWVETRKGVDVRAVVESAEPRAGGRLRLILRDVKCDIDGSEFILPGKIVWNWRKPDYDPAQGQDVAVRLRILPTRNFGNPGGWDYEWYWQRQGVFWRAWPAGRDAVVTWGDRPQDMLWRLKGRLRRAVAANIPDTQGGAMVLALVTGDKSRLELETSEATRAAGLAHTLALSGLHVGFVAAMGLGLAWIVGWIRPALLLTVPRPKLAVWLAAPLVLAYVWLGQPSHSLVRAGVMFGFWGFLLLQGRGRALVDGLFFALAVIVFYDPLSVFELSLQMSALAVAGIGLMYPRVRGLFRAGRSWWAKLLCWTAGLLAVSLCANLALLPLVSRAFGTWSPNILLNLVWLPALGFLVMPLGVAGMLLGVFPWTAPVGASLLSAAATVMDWLLALLHMAGGEGLTPVFAVLRPHWPEIVGCLLLVGLAVVAWTNRKAYVGLAGIGFMLLVWPHFGIMATDTLDEVRLSVIDVGQGQSLLLSTPGGHRWLIDGGGGSSNFDLGESVVAPYLTLGRPPRLDGVFMTHPDSDHSHGLPFILSRFEIGGFYTNGMMPRGRTGKRMKAVLLERGIVPELLQGGQRLVLGQDVSLEILHPDAGFESTHANEHSLVMRLVRRGKSLALLPGDVEKNGVRATLASGRDLDADVFVLPHHGSRSSHAPELYRLVSPEAVLCSSGYLNRYGFPHAEVVHGVGAPVFTTSRHGLLAGVWDQDNRLSVRVFNR